MSIKPFCQNKKCGSQNTIQRSSLKPKEDSPGEWEQRYECNDCKTMFYVEKVERDSYVLSEKEIEKLNRRKRLVFTFLDMTDSHSRKNLATLEKYCSVNKASLGIFGHFPKGNSFIKKGYSVDKAIEKYLIENRTLSLWGGKVFIGFPGTTPTAASPIKKYIPACPRDAEVNIFPHPNMAHDGVPNQPTKTPKYIMSTGHIASMDNMKDSAGSFMAENFTWNAGCLVLERNKDGCIFFRQLEIMEDGTMYDYARGHEGFYSSSDIGNGFGEYTGHFIPTDIDDPDDRPVSIIYAADFHSGHESEGIVNATFFNSDSICEVLKPKNILLGDFVDGETISHHDEDKDSYDTGLWLQGKTLKKELDSGIGILYSLQDLCKKIDSTLYEISANHPEFLLRKIEKKITVLNAWDKELYYMLKFWYFRSQRENFENGLGAHGDNPWKLYVEDIMGEDSQIFIPRHTVLEIDGMTVSAHTDQGLNGSRGSADQYGKMGEKYFAGHSHTPKRSGRCVQVGTMTKLSMTYSQGKPTTWANAHGLGISNGQQILTVMTPDNHKFPFRWRA